jgi:23S rRNA (uridine2552-2'-O)-methyltransferase
MARGSSKNNWLARQQRDPYVKQVQQSHYRSRAVYKLIEIDDKDHLFKQGQTIIDLGAAPGSWSQYVSEKIGDKGRLIAIDILPMEPIKNTLFLEGDFTERLVYEQCLQMMENSKADLVISDIAPNLSGIRAADQARSLYLAELSFGLAKNVLKKGGDMLIKVFEGEGTDTYRHDLKEYFEKITARKPKASRDDSREFYVLAQTFRL